MTNTATACPPMADRITKSLLGYGVIAGPVYVISVSVQAATRVGFDPTRHAASQLANGDLGWIQIATFVVTGAMTVAAAIGIRRALGAGRSSAWISGLIGAYGTALVVAAIFRADPSDGFPPGTPAGVGEPTWHGIVHLAVAGIGFICLASACLVYGARCAGNGERRWAWFSRATGTLFVATFGYLASGTGGRVAVLLFTAAVVLVWTWLTAVSVKLYRNIGAS